MTRLPVARPFPDRSGRTTWRYSCTGKKWLLTTRHPGCSKAHGVCCPVATRFWRIPLCHYRVPTTDRSGGRGRPQRELRHGVPAGERGAAAAHQGSQRHPACTPRACVNDWPAPTLYRRRVRWIRTLAVPGPEPAAAASLPLAPWLPPYSPDLNRVEVAWNKLKVLLKEFGARPKLPPTRRFAGRRIS